MLLINNFFCNTLPKKNIHYIGSNNNLRFYHHFRIPQIPCVRNKNFILWIHKGFLNDVHMSSCNETFSPFWNGICFAKKPFGEQFAVFHFTEYCVFRQNMFTKRKQVFKKRSLATLERLITATLRISQQNCAYKVKRKIATTVVFF